MSGPTIFDDQPHLAAFGKFLQGLNSESPRGAVLISLAMIDDLLERTILGFLLENAGADKLVRGFNAPLGSVSARSVAARALGLITEREYAEIETLRKIRNEFAHKMGASFEDQKIKDLCSNLTYNPQNYAEDFMAHARFITAATSLILNLTNRPHYVSQRRLAVQDWPY